MGKKKTSKKSNTETSANRESGASTGSKSDYDQYGFSTKPIKSKKKKSEPDTADTSKSKKKGKK